VREEFRSPTYDNRVWGEFHGLRQTGSVLDYTAKFRTMASKVPALDDRAKMQQYLWGLKPLTKAAAEFQQPTTLKEAVMTAQIYDDVHWGVTFGAAKGDRKGSPSSNMQRGAGRDRTATSSSYRPPSGQRLEFKAVVSSDEVYNERTRKGLCYGCGKGGHLYADCAKNKNRKAPPTERRSSEQNEAGSSEQGEDAPQRK